MTTLVPADAGVPSAERGGILVRRATDDDAPHLAGFAQRTFVEAFGASNTAENLALYLAKSFGPAIQLGEIRHADMITLLAELGMTLSGFAQLRRTPAPRCVVGPSPVELLRFYVDRPFHGRGIAQALMRSVFDAGRELGGRTVWLGVWERNPRAIAFYTKCGFVDVGEHTFTVGTDEQTDRVMARSLSP